MPRPPKIKTPLRIFRETIGQSQSSFAYIMEDLTGISPSTYKSYELDARKMSFDFAVRLMIRYGVDPDSIMTATGLPKDMAGKVYSRSSYEMWPGERIYSVEHVIAVIQRAMDRLIRMLLAARRAESFTLALQFLDKFVGELQEKLSLESHYRAISDEGKAFATWPPVTVYIGAGFVRQPERFDFALSESAVQKLKELDSQKSICRGLKRLDEFFRKEKEFFSPKRRP